MRFDVLTIFPTFFSSPVREGLLGKAMEAGAVEVNVVNMRDFATDRHKVVDDVPFGGGPGMVMKPEPICAAIAHARRANPGRAILMSPQGRLFEDRVARELAGEPGLILVCGRYEGVDERVLKFVDMELSIGDYILSGGEAAAFVVIEAVSRFLPGVVGDGESVQTDTFFDGLMKHPQYTRPRAFMDAEVPEVLLSGNHERIRQWRRRESLRRTLERRPDLLLRARLSEEDMSLLEDIKTGTGVPS
jgi:tRNA (guanine37-N1)-methyltransferase